MADDAERAAKAARAKAMLKKRQQQKAVGPSPSPSPAPGTLHKVQVQDARSPSPRSPEHKDAALLFGDTDKAPVDFGEFGVLSHAKSPVSPPPVTSPPPPVTSPPLPTSPQNGDAASDAMRTLIQNQQQTISLLVNEKASLTAQLERLEDLEAKSTENEKLLNDERRRAEALASRLRHREEQARSSAERLDEVAHREREANEKCREQDRELDLIRRQAGELKAQLNTREHEFRALKEQVEADDRVETLERSLKGTQDRAEELEFQLSKVKQSHTTATRERDALTEELARLTTSEAEWKQRHATLEQESGSSQHELSALSSSLDAAERARADLENQLAASESSLADAQQRLSHTASELTSHARQLHSVQSDAGSAQQRADDAEQAQRSLQAENSGLLAQLSEVRPKVVELSNKVAEDEERIWEAKKREKSLEATVTRLEAQLEEQRAAEEELREISQGLEVEKTRDAERHGVDMKELQDAYTKLARDLEQIQTRAEKLERENSEQRATMQVREQDKNHWKTQADERHVEVEEIKNELSAQRKVEDETLAIVERSQAEVKALRDQLALREDELARMRDGTSRATSPHKDEGHSLVEEMLSAARQQHALDLSSSHSRIRELETEVFDTQAKAHTLQRRVTAVEGELAQLRAAPADAGTPPPFPGSSSFHGGSEDSRRHSLSSTRPHTPSRSFRPLIAARAVYDENLSPETRHKRKVSLSMLKARIESERAVAQHADSVSVAASPRLTLTRGLSSVAIAETEEPGDSVQTPRKGSLDSRPSLSHSQSRLSELAGRGSKRPPQFLDESHVFWCHSCHGDLVVL